MIPREQIPVVIATGVLIVGLAIGFVVEFIKARRRP